MTEAESSEPFQCTVRRTGDEAIIRIVGDVDMATAPTLAAAMTEVSDAGARRVVVDVSELRFIDSSGLNVLVEAGKRLGGTDTVHITSPTPAIRRLLEITGLLGVFRVDDSP